MTTQEMLVQFSRRKGFTAERRDAFTEGAKAIAERDTLRAQLAAANSMLGTWEAITRKTAEKDGVQYVGPNTASAISDVATGRAEKAEAELKAANERAEKAEEQLRMVEACVENDDCADLPLVERVANTVSSLVMLLNAHANALARATQAEAEHCALAARVAEWEEWFGCSSPHDTEAAKATILGKEQARANRLAARVAELEVALECVPVDLINAIENGEKVRIFLSTESCKLIGAALASTPAQSLAKVQAAALNSVHSKVSKWQTDFFVNVRREATGSETLLEVWKECKRLEAEAENG